jgi:hypothetical protein|tara:strand:+ start:367 stop:501 length:135 start_codon:yes stop_codon:yes gene_type:complete
MTGYDYEFSEFDEAREAYGEEYEHAEDCGWIYGDCDCGLMEETF